MHTIRCTFRASGRPSCVALCLLREVTSRESRVVSQAVRTSLSLSTVLVPYKYCMDMCVVYVCIIWKVSTPYPPFVSLAIGSIRIPSNRAQMLNCSIWFLNFMPHRIPNATSQITHHESKYDDGIISTYWQLSLRCRIVVDNCFHSGATRS